MHLQAILEDAARQALTKRLQDSLRVAHADAAAKMDGLLATQNELQVLHADMQLQPMPLLHNQQACPCAIKIRSSLHIVPSQHSISCHACF